MGESRPSGNTEVTRLDLATGDTCGHGSHCDAKRFKRLVEGDLGWRLERHNAGLGPLVGPLLGSHDVGSRPAPAAPLSPDVEPR